MPIIAYFGRMKSIWDELENYEQVHICTREVFKCNIGSHLENRREVEKVHQFLTGLDDTLYGIVRTNMTLVDPLRTLNRVYTILIQQERVNTITCAEE